MSNQIKTTPALSEQILELRYKANPVVLDNRGIWTKDLSQQLTLPHWRIAQDRLDVFDELQKERVFVSHHNAGIISQDAPTHNFFIERAQKFLRILFDFDPFANDIIINRIGVRFRACSLYSGSFEKLLSIYQENFVRFVAYKELEASVKDMGLVVTFQDNIGRFQVQSGPMKQDQLREFFTREPAIKSPEIKQLPITYPDVGLYIDIDYWREPEGALQVRDVIETVRKFNERCWLRHQQITDLILNSNA